MKQNATGNFYIHDRRGGAQGGSRMAGHMTFYIFYLQCHRYEQNNSKEKYFSFKFVIVSINFN